MTIQIQTAPKADRIGLATWVHEINSSQAAPSEVRPGAVSTAQPGATTERDGPDKLDPKVLEPIFRAASALASPRFETTPLSDAEVVQLSEVFAPLADKYLGDYVSRFPEEAAAFAVAAMVLTPRISEYRARKRALTVTSEESDVLAGPEPPDVAEYE